MLKNEIDDIIANAVEEQNGHRRVGNGRKQRDVVATIRRILNICLIAGAILTVIFYFAFPENKSIYIITGITSLALKIVEFGLRFIS